MKKHSLIVLIAMAMSSVASAADYQLVLNCNVLHAANGNTGVVGSDAPKIVKDENGKLYLRTRAFAPMAQPAYTPMDEVGSSDATLTETTIYQAGGYDITLQSRNGSPYAGTIKVGSQESNCTAPSMNHPPIMGMPIPRHVPGSAVQAR